MSQTESNSQALTSSGQDATPTCDPKQPENFTIAVSAGVLFNMEEQGMPLSPGPAFSFVKALGDVNTRLRELDPESEELFHVVVITNNHHQGLIDTISHHKLSCENKIIDGNDLIGRLMAIHTNLYLSAEHDEVQMVLDEGIAAATMYTPENMSEVSADPLRVAFDGDGVLFSDESERIFKAHGLDKFNENEKTHENNPLGHGPLKGFLEALGKLQKKFYDKGQHMKCPIRTYLVTARGATSSGIRALKTLCTWKLNIDEAFFLAGAPKGPMLERIKPHIFFDDQINHVKGAAKMGTVACHVPYGIAQSVTQKRGTKR